MFKAPLCFSAFPIHETQAPRDNTADGESVANTRVQLRSTTRSGHKRADVPQTLTQGAVASKEGADAGSAQALLRTSWGIKQNEL